MLSELSAAKKVVGVKQTTKAIREGLAKTVFVAQDAEKRITGPIIALCAEQGVSVAEAETMAELGRAAGIHVGAAVVATLS